MRLVFDIETDHYSIVRVQNIWCVVAQDLDTGEVYKFRNAKAAVELLKKADLLIAHNGIMYDLPVLQRLAGFQFEEWPKTLDTIILSRLFYNNVRHKHSLDSWGKDLGNHKGDFKDFSGFSMEMLEYCIQDVKVTSDLYNRMKSDWDLKAFTTCIKLEHDFAKVMSQQVLNGFQLDLERAERMIEEFDLEAGPLETELANVLPKVKDLTDFRNVIKEGRLVSETVDGYWYVTSVKREERFKTWKFTDPNPNSNKQIIQFFKEKYDWVPTVFTDKSEEIRENLIRENIPWNKRKTMTDEEIHTVIKDRLPEMTPKIDEEVLLDLEYPEAKVLARLKRIKKMRAMITGDAEEKGWIGYLVNGRVHGSIKTNNAATGRATHSNPNLANVDKKNINMRKCWVPREGWDLISVDADALEMRILASIISKFDDGHLTNVIENGTKEEGTDFHSRTRDGLRLSSRDTAKVVAYSFIYGTGNEKLGRVVSRDGQMNLKDTKDFMKLGGEKKNQLFETVVGLKELIDSLDMNNLYGIDGRPLWPRKKNAVLNYLVQGGGSSIVKKAVVNAYTLISEAGLQHFYDWGLNANIHDEQVSEAKREYSQLVADCFIKGFEMTTEQFKLHCPIRAQGQIGKNWGEIH